MRVLVTCFPGKGHFHPLAPLALEFQTQGHDVVVATGEDLAGWVRACGLRACAAGLTEHDAVQRARAEAPAGAPFGPYMFAAVTPAPMLDDLRRLASGWRPDLVIHEESEYAAPLLATEIEVPCVTHSWPTPALPAETRAWAMQWLQPLWSNSGLGEPRTVGDMYLDCCPGPLQTPDIAAVQNVVPVRPVLFDGPANDAGLGEAPHPLAYVTLGTVAAFARAETLAHIATAVAAQVASVVVTTGPVRPGSLGALPQNVRAKRYLPQRHVLAHSDVVVSHGGAGSVLGGLLHRLPQLVLPQGAPSQQRCADQVARLGAGIALASADQSAETIEAAVRRLLDDHGYRVAAARIADALELLPDPSTVVNELTRRFRL